MIKLESTVRDLTFGDLIIEGSTAASLAQLAVLATALITEVHETIARLDADAALQRPQVADAVLLGDSVLMRRLERMRGVLQRALGRQLALIKQARELSDAGNQCDGRASIVVDVRVIARAVTP